jgi:hypothetical protein
MATLVLVIAAIGAQIGLLICQQHRQDEAIREIRIMRGECSLRSAGPAWLRSLVGEQRMKNFDEVEEVVFPTEMAIFDRGTTGTMFSSIRTDRPAIDDITLACVTKLPSLKRLNLRWTNIGDAGMRYVSELGTLEELVLVGAEVTDASVGRLKRLRSLKKLDVSLTLMTASGVAELQAALPSCRIVFHRRLTYREYLKRLNPKLEVKKSESD